jgi:hypothetical protein
VLKGSTPKLNRRSESVLLAVLRIHAKCAYEGFAREKITVGGKGEGGGVHDVKNLLPKNGVKHNVNIDQTAEVRF